MLDHLIEKLQCPNYVGLDIKGRIIIRVLGKRRRHKMKDRIHTVDRERNIIFIQKIAGHPIDRAIACEIL
ncbi:hypothetical protein WL93_24805 [Burkholderia diffusa]|nr:hypothetical protein WL93_24805 [Burkholderia diffusa]